MADGIIRAVHPLAIPRTANDTRAALRNSPHFADLPDALLDVLGDEVTWLRCMDGDVVTRQGEVADGMFIVVSGSLRAVAELPSGQELPLATLHPGECAGEIGLLTGSRRTSTVCAVGETVLLTISTSAFHGLEHAYPELAERISRLAVARLRHSELVMALERSEVFGALDDLVRADLERELESVFVTSGVTLFNEGDPGDCLYIIARGRLRVVRRARGSETGYPAELGPGDSVGELALLTNEPRTATVLAVRDTHLARLTRDSFDRLLGQHPLTLTRAFSRASVRGLIGTAAGGPPLVSGSRTLAVLAVSPDVPLGAFCEALSRALETNGAGPTLHISSSRLDSILGQSAAQLGEGTPASARAQAWLGEQELAHALVLYEADPTPSAWGSHCVHQADEILLVGRAESDPSLGPMEAWLRHIRQGLPHVSQSLVLVHGDAARPMGTSRWVAARQIEQHHHIHRSSTEDFDRLGRFLAGRAVGLVLGGGGARGFAHAGVVRAIREAGIPIDAVGGTSAGAVFGAECAMGWSDAEMVRETAAISTSVADPTLPMVSLIAGKKGSRTLQQRLGDLEIEDMWLPFFCVSANLSRATSVVHRSGSLARAMMATNAAPGIYPPVVIDGDLHVDGALLDNLPVNAMSRLLRGGSIIAVDVSPRVDLTANADYGLGLSGWRVLWNKLNPAGPSQRIPSILEILMRTVELGSIYQQQQTGSGASLYLRPPLERYRLFDYRRGPEIAETAYGATREEVRSWAAARVAARTSGRLAAQPST
jgi:predicted acylesterase/phospholipase RssA/CRP-like cAMP-binding protein